jgi:hypothetical protein
LLNVNNFCKFIQVQKNIMKVTIRELEVELEAETDHERDALNKILRFSAREIVDGRTADEQWDPRTALVSNKIVIKLQNPNEWGR